MMSLGLLLYQRAQERGEVADPSRIASTVVQGNGFLARGVIFAVRSRVRGLTTAAGISVAAAVGLFLGAGYFLLEMGAVALSILSLVAFGWIEQKLPRNHSNQRVATDGGTSVPAIALRCACAPGRRVAARRRDPRRGVVASPRRV